MVNLGLLYPISHHKSYEEIIRRIPTNPVSCPYNKGSAIVKSSDWSALCIATIWLLWKYQHCLHQCNENLQRMSVRAILLRVCLNG